MVLARGPRYRLGGMTPSPPRRSPFRRAVPILALLVVIAIASLSLGPVLSARLAPTTTATASPAPATHLPARTAVPDPAPSFGTTGATGIQRKSAVADPARAATRLALKKRLDGIQEKYGIPGVSVTIIFPDGSQWVGTSGLADVAGEAPVTPDTAFAIASISKTYTAALIMALAEEDRLRLDAPLSTYLPGLRVDTSVTVRQLLDHTSGLDDYFYHGEIDAVLLGEPDRRWTELEALSYVGKPYFKPGRGWHYSNTNYLVLGLLAEWVGEAPLGEQLRTRFLEPFGLDRTFYQPTESTTGPVARGYRVQGAAPGAAPIDLTGDGEMVPFASVVTAAAGAGALAATSGDVARWARALYAGRVLEPASVRAMVDDAARTARYRAGVPYGLGVQVVDVANERTLGHSGRLLGFRSVVRHLQDAGFTIAVMTNQSRTDPAIIARALLKIAQAPVRDCPCLDVGRGR